VVAHIFTWLFVFAVPWQDMVVLPGLGTISKALGIGALGATVLDVLLRGRVRRLSPFHWVVFTFMCWVLLSTFWAVAQPESVQRKVSTYIQILVMVWVIWETTATPARLASLMQAYVLGAYVAAGSTLHNYAAGISVEKVYGRFVATGFDANDLGMMLALALPMAWYLASSGSSVFRQWLNRAYFVIGTVAILLTGSRGAMIATLVALSVIPLTLTHMRTGVKIAAILAVLISGFAAVKFVPKKSFERLSTTGEEITEGTMTGRISIWKSGIAAIPARPFQGFGPAGWYPAAGTVGKRIRSPHSTYLSILVEEGIFGFLIFLTLFIVVWKRLLALPTFERRVGLTLLATLAIAIAPLGWDVYKALWLVLALLAGWSAVVAPVRRAAVPAPVPSSLRRPRTAPTPATAE
jgi:O-antigen ligase